MTSDAKAGFFSCQFCGAKLPPGDIEPDCCKDMLKLRISGLRTSLQDVATSAAANVRPKICEKVIEQAECPDYDTTLGCQHRDGHPMEVCKTHDDLWSDCSYRPFTDRIVELQSRMAVRAIYTFTRRVDEEWLDPSKGIHYSARADGTPYAYDVPDGVHPVTKDESPPGLYPVVVVPKELVGQVVVIRRVAHDEGERL